MKTHEKGVGEAMGQPGAPPVLGQGEIEPFFSTWLDSIPGRGQAVPWVQLGSTRQVQVRPLWLSSVDSLFRPMFPRDKGHGPVSPPLSSEVSLLPCTLSS